MFVNVCGVPWPAQLTVTVPLPPERRTKCLPRGAVEGHRPPFGLTAKLTVLAGNGLLPGPPTPAGQLGTCV